MTTGGEICYIKNNPSDNDLPDIYCFTDGSTDLQIRGHVHYSNGTPIPIDVRAFDAWPQATSFFIANAVTGHIIQVAYGGYIQNEDFGGLGTLVLDFYYPHTGLGGHQAGSNSQVKVTSNCGGQTCVYTLTASGYILDVTYPMSIFDLEIDRRISVPATPYTYLIANTFASTLAEDTIHDVRGFIDAFDENSDGSYERLMLNVNTTSYIESEPYFQDPWAAANQHPVIISSYPPESLQDTLGYPVAAQDKPRFIKIRFRGWPGAIYYLRIMDPLDFIGYALGVNNADDPADCKTESGGGPFMSRCDNFVWKQARKKNDIGFCLLETSCSTPYKKIQMTGSST